MIVIVVGLVGWPLLLSGQSESESFVDSFLLSEMCERNGLGRCCKWTNTIAENEETVSIITYTFTNIFLHQIRPYEFIPRSIKISTHILQNDQNNRVHLDTREKLSPTTTLKFTSNSVCVALKVFGRYFSCAGIKYCNVESVQLWGHLTSVDCY